MKNKTDIRPSFPYVLLSLSIVFLFFSIILFTGKDNSIIVYFLSYVFLLFSIGFIVIINITCQYISFDNNSITIIGYFGIKKKSYCFDEIKGYELHQRYNEFNGVNDNVVLVFNSGKKILFPRLAYTDYTNFSELIDSEFNFLGHKKLKYSDLYAKTIPIITLLSGILALIVGIMKFIK